MKNTIFIIIFLFAIFFINAQKVGELTLLDGTKIEMYPKKIKKGKVLLPSYSGQTIYYYTKQGKSRSINHSKVKRMITSEGRYELLPIYVFGAKRLHRIVAENEDYLLTNYYSLNRYQFYIFDKKTMKAKEKLKILKFKKKKDIKLVELIAKYFGNCPDLMKKIQANFDEVYNKKDYKKFFRNSTPQDILFKDISNFECD